MITRRTAGLLLAALTLLPALVAAPPARADSLDVDAVTAPIARFHQALLATMKASADSFQQRYDMLAPAVARTFDLDFILRNCVGPRWLNFTPGQQSALADVFAQFTTASWVANFARYNGEQFVIVPELRSAGADQIVQTRITTADGAAHLIDYQMHQTADGWRAVDVLLDGTISRVAVQRSDFRRFLSDNSPDPLIDQLRLKVANLSGGSLSP